MARSRAAKVRAPLTRERVLAAAMTLADAHGLEAVTMREVAKKLGVEAMSLYKHVANKNDILDGLVDLVVSEMLVPKAAHWKAALRARALSAREVLLRHPWAPVLVESRMAPGPGRMRHYDAIIGILRRDGFSMELAYGAFLTLDSYIYGFTMQEIAWPFEPEQRPELIEGLRPDISPTSHPHLVEMMNFLASRHHPGKQPAASSAAGYSADFEFGLDLILDGLERARPRKQQRDAKG